MHATVAVWRTPHLKLVLMEIAMARGAFVVCQLFQRVWRSRLTIMHALIVLAPPSNG